MGIRKLQITKKMEEIVKSYLFRGRYPSFQTITQHYSEWLREHTPGTPLFKPIKVFRKQKSDSSQFNRQIETINEDIQNAFKATIDQNNQVMSNFDFIETERGKLQHELKVLSKQIDELLLMNQSTDFKYLNGYTISFEDANDVDLSKSNIFVDLQNEQITLMENLSQSNQIQINANMVEFHPLQPANKHVALESMNYAFDDYLNTAWWHVVKTKELPAENKMKAELIIHFNQEELLNNIEYVPHQSKPVNVSIEYTLDGSSYTPIVQNAQTDRVTETKVWDFPQIRAKGIKLIFTKDDYDERNGDYYNYYFGAKKIAIYRKHYLSKGTLYTNPIIFDDVIQQLSIRARHQIPFNTSTQYDVALFDPNKPLEDLIWHPISSINETNPKFATVVNLREKKKIKMEANRAEATGETINGMQVFKLVKDNGNGIVSEILIDTQDGTTEENFQSFYNPKLFRGINQWKRERTYIPFTGEIPLNSMWDEQYRNRPQLIRTDYQMKGNELDLTRGYGGFDDNFYRFSISIYSDHERNEPLSLSVMTTTDNGTRKRLGVYSVYLNKKRLAPVNDEVTLSFIPGWNEIQILYHWGDVQERKDANRSNLPEKTFIGKFNLMKETRVRGDHEHMTYVDVHSLFHNISPNNHNYFSIYERQVVLNYLPTNCIFQLVYDADKLKRQHNQIVLRAQMERSIDAPHITPKIQQIQLRVK